MKSVEELTANLYNNFTKPYKFGEEENPWYRLAVYILSLITEAERKARIEERIKIAKMMKEYDIENQNYPESEYEGLSVWQFINGLRKERITPDITTHWDRYLKELEGGGG